LTPRRAELFAVNLLAMRRSAIAAKSRRRPFHIRRAFLSLLHRRRRQSLT